MSQSESVSLSDGLTIVFRPLAGEEDYAALAAIHEGSKEWDQIDPLSARESIPTAETLAATFPFAEVRQHPDLLLATVEGQVVGYVHVLWRWTEESGTRVYLHLGYLLPEWRGKGIGTAMLMRAQNRIRELVASERPAGPIMLATNVSSTEREADALMRKAGYIAVRRLSDMVRGNDAAPMRASLPQAAEVRPLETAHYREIYAAWKDAFAGIMTSTPVSEEDYQEFIDTTFDVPGFDPSLCRVAWSGDQVTGFVVSRLRRGVAIIQEVAVRKAWQRRGLARGLMAEVLQILSEREVPQVRLFTDADDGQGARSLYEALGFRELKQHIFYRRPL
ncbi:MAG TPA: GNAT family N-acetyltransferase [Herpetosiphonaceae bacterium]|nr:GNAT family N-acetyltransferase [Herpetosiphonaceae bacterium]